MYSGDYVTGVLQTETGSPAESAALPDRDWVLGRLLATQEGLARFKQTPLNPNKIDTILEAFLRRHGGTLYN